LRIELRLEQLGEPALSHAEVTTTAEGIRELRRVPPEQLRQLAEDAAYQIAKGLGVTS